jgi:hypothetical protein
MKLSIRLAEILKDQIHRRGLIAEIEDYTGIERHTVAGLLNNTVKYVSIEALAKISDYLIQVQGVDPSTLPGALIGRDPELFWDMLAGCEQLDFCLGTRVSEEWPGAEYVMATDSRLQGVLLSKLARFEIDWGAPPAQDEPEDKAKAKEGLKPKREPVRRHLYPEFHLVPAPDRHVTAKNPGPKWPDVRAQIESLYYRRGEEDPDGGRAGDKKEKEKRKGSALIALGSVKVNPVVEMMLATTFGADPFVSQDQVARAKDRRCPIMFRYRHADPQPPACCGGVQVAADTAAPQAGLYYEVDKGKWECCPSITESSDAAFLFYAYRPNLAQVDVACGGFSSRATNCLTERLDQIIPEMGEPQFVSEKIHAGVWVIRLSYDPKDSNYDQYKDNRPFEHKVIALPEKVVARHLKHWE